MLKHVVLFKLKENAENKSKSENALLIKDMLEGLKGIIKEIKKIEVGINIRKDDSQYDVILYSEFKDAVDLKLYLEHPEHKKAGEFLIKVKDERVVFDYEC